jgi:Gamma-glutamyl cyclotransferase, AIG2-like
VFTYFAYGANVDPGRMSQRIPGAALLGPARLDDYAVEFTIRDREWGGGVLNIRPEPGSSVYGVVYQGSDEAFAALDTYQGEASLMAKEHVTVVGPAGPADAVTYRVASMANYVRPTDSYLRHMTNALSAAGLPEEAVESLLNADRFGRSDRGPSIVS